MIGISRGSAGIVLAGCWAVCAMAWGQSPASNKEAKELVRRAVALNLEQDQHHRNMRYELRKIDARQDTTRDVIETKDGSVARLVARNGKPLSAEQAQAEVERLESLKDQPDIMERRARRERKDQAHVDHLMSLLPDAFVFTMKGAEPCPSGECYRIGFTPDPNYHAPELEADLFKGCAGDVWIDKAQERMTRLEVHFIADVDFGFGILAKINKGGTVEMEQIDAGPRENGFHDWEVSLMKLTMNGRAMLVKSINMNMTQELKHFTPVQPGTDYRAAIDVLRRDALETRASR
jgi:hypothetical protein